MSDAGTDGGSPQALCPDRSECRAGQDGGQPTLLLTGYASPEDDTVDTLPLEDGSYIVAGQYYGSVDVLGTELPDPAGGGVGWNVYVARVEASGTVDWVHAYGEEGRSIMLRKVLRLDGGLVLAVASLGNDDTVGELVSLSLTGDFGALETVSRGPARTGSLMAAAVSPVGIVVSGEFFGNGTTLGGDSLVGLNASTRDPAWFAYVATWVPGKGTRWIQTEEMDDPNPSWAAHAVLSLKVAGDGTVYWSHSYRPQVIEAFSARSGHRLFRTTLASTPVSPFGWAITPTPDSTVIVAGSFDARGAPFSFAGQAVQSQSTNDLYIAEIGKDGEGKWMTTVPGPQVVWSAAMSGSGELVIGGQLDQVSDDWGVGLITSDGLLQNTFLAAFSRSGDPLWARFLGEARAGKSYGGSFQPYDGSIYPYGMESLADGSFLVSGSFWGEVNFGVGDELSHEWASSFLLRFTP